MKKIKLCILILMLCTACQSTQSRLSLKLHISISDYQEIDSFNERGWFNDGITSIVFSFDDSQFLDEAKSTWKPLPLTSSLQEKIDNDDTLPQIKIPKNGYYYFEDRTPKDSSYLLNYTLALYDQDQHQIHYIESDS